MVYGLCLSKGVMNVEALLTRKWLSICLGMGSSMVLLHLVNCLYIHPQVLSLLILQFSFHPCSGGVRE